MNEVGYLYFNRSDYACLKMHFPGLYLELERFVTKRYPEVELQVTDTQTEMLDNKVLMLIGDSATAPNGNPSPEAIKLENICDLA